MNELKRYAQEWDKNAAQDALWVILTDPARYGNKWDLTSFYLTGEEEVARVFGFMESSAIKVPRNAFLDFGCGVGRISKALSQRFEYGFGLDISEKMVQLARQYVPSVCFIANQDITLSPLGDESISFVYSHIVLQHIPRQYQERYIDEFLRVLVPGGLAVFQVLIELINPISGHVPFNIKAKRWLKEKFPLLTTVKQILRRRTPPAAEFRYEMHLLPSLNLEGILAKRGCFVEAKMATNSFEPDHNGRIEFYDLLEHRRLLEHSEATNAALSCMYFVRKPRRKEVSEAFAELH